MSDPERADISDAIWLCAKCATLIDRDENKYSVEEIHRWKILRETEAAAENEGRSVSSAKLYQIRKSAHFTPELRNPDGIWKVSGGVWLNDGKESIRIGEPTICGPLAQFFRIHTLGYRTKPHDSALGWESVGLSPQGVSVLVGNVVLLEFTVKLIAEPTCQPDSFRVKFPCKPYIDYKPDVEASIRFRPVRR